MATVLEWRCAVAHRVGRPTRLDALEELGGVSPTVPGASFEFGMHRFGSSHGSAVVLHVTGLSCVPGGHTPLVPTPWHAAGP